MPSFFIALSLYQFEMPDIDSYREHYNLARDIGFDIFDYQNNFEIGYIFLVFIASKIISFDFFLCF